MGAISNRISVSLSVLFSEPPNSVGPKAPLAPPHVVPDLVFGLAYSVFPNTIKSWKVDCAATYYKNIYFRAELLKSQLLLCI